MSVDRRSMSAEERRVEGKVPQHIFPLDEFYTRELRPLPPVEAIPAAELPEPYRTLLAHDRDMTPTLEAHYGADIHIEVWGRHRRNSDYFREVVLRLDTNQRPVEFGANRINLALFGPEERRLILDEYLPLGRILQQRRVPHTGGPTAFLRLTSDQLMNRALGLRPHTVLYGRCNAILDTEGRPLSEVVEILPPA